DAAGSLAVKATDTETINAVGVAASAAIGIGGEGGGAFSGAGARADNPGATPVQSYIHRAGGTGSAPDRVSLRAGDTPRIRADVVGASLAAGIGPGTAGVSLSIGVSLADNQITDDVAAYIKNANDHVTARAGDVKLQAHVLEDQSGITHRYTTSSGTQTLNVGDRVSLAPGYAHGGDAGSVYRYLGADYNYTTNYFTEHGLQDTHAHLHPNDKVQLVGGYTGGGVPGAVYQYTGSDTDLDLGTQNYATGPWTPVQ